MFANYILHMFCLSLKKSNERGVSQKEIKLGSAAPAWKSMFHWLDRLNLVRQSTKRMRSF